MPRLAGECLGGMSLAHYLQTASLIPPSQSRAGRPRHDGFAA